MRALAILIAAAATQSVVAAEPPACVSKDELGRMQSEAMLRMGVPIALTYMQVSSAKKSLELAQSALRRCESELPSGVDPSEACASQRKGVEDSEARLATIRTESAKAGQALAMEMMASSRKFPPACEPSAFPDKP